MWKTLDEVYVTIRVCNGLSIVNAQRTESLKDGKSIKPKNGCCVNYRSVRLSTAGTRVNFRSARY